MVLLLARQRQVKRKVSNAHKKGLFDDWSDVVSPLASFLFCTEKAKRHVLIPANSRLQCTTLHTRGADRLTELTD
jgi:hypothetical protein